MKKYHKKVTVATALALLASQVMVGNHARANSLPDALTPIQDGYWDNLGSETSSPDNFVGYDDFFGVQRSAIQFDLADVNPTFSKAKLRIYITSTDNGTNEANPHVTLVGSTYGEWDGTFPMNSSDEAIEPYVNDTVSNVGYWKEFDVTSYLKQQLVDQNSIVTFALLGDVVDSAFFIYSSDDDPNGRFPELVFEYQSKLPQVTDADTTEDQQNGSGLVLTPNAAEDTSHATHFQITDVHGGALYLNDGTMPINEGSYISTQEGGLGLKFKPNPNANTPDGNAFGFTVKAAQDAQGKGLSAGVPVVITVSEVNDAPVAEDDTLSPVTENSGERTISFAELLGNDSKGANNESNQTLTITSVGNAIGGSVRIDEANENAIFTPDPNFRGLASFTYTVKDNGTTDGAPAPMSSDPGTVSFTIQAPADMPIVTDATTAEDTPNADGLVLTPTSAGGETTTHFKISGITGGNLYQRNGATPIQDGDYITVSEGGAGLKFAPAANAYGTTGFGFNVQAAPGTTGTLLSGPVPAIITVSEVNDAPTAANDQLPQVKQGTPNVTIPFSDLTDNDQAGPNENGQTLTVVDVSQAQGGTVSLGHGQVEFVPNIGFQGEASFTYTVEDNGTTEGDPDPLTATAQAKFNVEPTEKPVIQLNGDADVYVLVGQAYQEPGYFASDDENHDLTHAVTVSGTADTTQLGTYTLRYNVSDHTNNPAIEVTRKVHVISVDLASFTVNAGALSPVYDQAARTYTLDVPNSVNSLSVTASTVDPTATLTVNGSPKNNGESSTLNLLTGRNDYTIVVTAQGGATRTYTLEVTRQSAPVPTPTPSPGHSTTIPEQQHHLNDQAKEAIKESKDGKWINEQVESALEHLSDVVEPSDVDDSTKLDLVANTVTDVFEPLMDKWEQGVITRAQLNELLDTFLDNGLNKVMAHVDLEDEEVFKKGTETVNTLIEKVITKLEDDQVKGSVADQLGNAMNRLLETKNAIHVQSRGEVDGIGNQLKQIDTMVKDWSKGLGGKAGLFDLERHLIVQVDDEADAKSLRANQAETISEPTISFKQETVKELGDKGFVVTVKNEEGASMKLPASFFTEHKRDDVAFIVEANKAAKIPSSHVKASDAYAFKITAGDKEISTLSKGELVISIPYEYKSKSLTPYSYDAKRKSWKQMTAARSKPLVIEKAGDLMRFSTASLQTYMLAETGVRSISVDQRSLKLEKGASQQLKVTGSLSSGRKVDLSTEEDGTTYTSSKPELITVDEDGMISVSADAKDGTKATITVKNGKSTTKVNVAVFSLQSMVISPSSASVTAGKRLQLKVYAVYSDRSRVEISKESTGTTYSLEENEFATISKDGLLTISEDAPDGTELTITVANKEVSATSTVKVKMR